jgi:hypothetical protein
MTTDPFDFEAVEQSAIEANDALKRAQAIFADDFRWLMADVRGRRIARRILTDTGVFDEKTPDGEAGLKAVGRRSFGTQFLIAITDNAPQQYGAMIQEAQL